VGYLPDVSRRGPLYESPFPADDGFPALKVSELEDGSFHFAYRDQTTFVVNRSGSEVWIQWPACCSLEHAALYLLGPVLGFTLRLRGVVSLHASGVRIGDSAIAILGHAGAGKSTTAAAFARLGHPVITDDVFALKDCGNAFSVLPGCPGLRLWPDSVESLWGSPEVLPPLLPNWDKRFLDLRGNGFEFISQPMPVSAIYCLGPRSEHATAPEITGGNGHPLIDLIAHAYVNYLLDRQARAHEFDVLTRLARSVPFRRVTPQAEASRLPELCKAIRSDAESLTALQAV
jgi:energy-coupling factor transporter ATP-binding protein EcfA2